MNVCVCYVKHRFFNVLKARGGTLAVKITKIIFDDRDRTAFQKVNETPNNLWRTNEALLCWGVLLRLQDAQDLQN